MRKVTDLWGNEEFLFHKWVTKKETHIYTYALVEREDGTMKQMGQNEIKFEPIEPGELAKTEK